MDIIPVLDLAGGQAVWARGGDRARYEPVDSPLSPEAVGEPAPLLGAFRRRLGATGCYVADLDAIQGGPVQRALLRELAQIETGFAGAILVDAGAHTPGGAFEVLACGASQVVIGLETLRAFADLDRIVRVLGPGRVVFSLDLRGGTPILHPAMGGERGTVASDAPDVAARAVAAGAAGLLLLDLARVGTGAGADLGLLATLRARFPSVRLLAGGGVRSRDDLERMRDAGCDAALVASAIHAGTITAADLAQVAGARAGTPPRDQSPSVSR